MFYILQNNNYLGKSRILFEDLFQDCMLGGASVASTSEVRASAISY
jgi:hypothetical protein